MVLPRLPVINLNDKMIHLMLVMVRTISTLYYRVGHKYHIHRCRNFDEIDKVAFKAHSSAESYVRNRSSKGSGVPFNIFEDDEEFGDVLDSFECPACKALFQDFFLSKNKMGYLSSILLDFSIPINEIAHLVQYISDAIRTQKYDRTLLYELIARIAIHQNLTILGTGTFTDQLSICSPQTSTTNRLVDITRFASFVQIVLKILFKNVYREMVDESFLWENVLTADKVDIQIRIYSEWVDQSLGLTIDGLGFDKTGYVSLSNLPIEQIREHMDQRTIVPSNVPFHMPLTMSALMTWFNLLNNRVFPLMEKGWTYRNDRDSPFYHSVQMIDPDAMLERVKYHFPTCIAYIISGYTVDMNARESYTIGCTKKCIASSPYFYVLPCCARMCCVGHALPFLEREMKGNGLSEPSKYVCTQCYFLHKKKRWGQ